MATDDDRLLGEFLSNHADVVDKPIYANGSEIGGWVVTGFLGRGGSSEVYCVRHGETGAPAAMKVLHRSEERLRARFLREEEFLARNKNKALPLFHAKGVVDTHPYFIMELLEPRPLPRGDRAVARYVCSVAEGLEWLHLCGYVHRDIKPGNILWRTSSAGSEPVLVDFGLIKEKASESLPQGEGLSIVDGKAVGVGTPRYAAPEQFEGGQATPATDIHALGRLAYECFDGKPSRAWSRIIRRATSSIPGERYQSAADFIHAVRRRHSARNVAASALAAATLACAILLWAAKGGVDDLRWRLMCETVTTNIVTSALCSQEFRTNEVNGVMIAYPSGATYRRTTQSVEATILSLNGTTNVFSHPLKLSSGREHWIVGPGALDAVFRDSRGAVLRISNCRLVNRTDESLKDGGIRYVIYKNTVLDFPNIPRDVDGERSFLSMSTGVFPADDTAERRGVDPTQASVKYKRDPAERPAAPYVGK